MRNDEQTKVYEAQAEFGVLSKVFYKDEVRFAIRPSLPSSKMTPKGTVRLTYEFSHFVEDDNHEGGSHLLRPVYKVNSVPKQSVAKIKSNNGVKS